MVTKITFPKSIEAALNYNEKKLQKGKAECLYAANYLGEANKMGFYQKLAGFERRNSMNQRATTKTIHISLNFSPSENLPDQKMIAIASDYMQSIGFGEQPFLVYKHEDAGHPHLHVVCTTIRDDGTRINTHNIGRNQSEKARKEIEQKYGLIKAGQQTHLLKQAIKPVNVEKAIYGTSETKQTISNVVNAVFSQYKFTSLPEFNAALKQFNVVADRGKEEGRIYKNRGLVYRILDADGNKIGVPIKASSITSKPTLDNLEKKFVANDPARELLKQRIKNVIDDCLQSSVGNMKSLVTALSQKQVYTVLRQNTEGRLYGITFVDNQTKVVFNGSDLGKGYSVAALQNRVGIVNETKLTNEAKGEYAPGTFKKNRVLQKPQEKSNTPSMKSEGLLETLLSVREQNDNVPNNLIKKKKKKKRKYHDL